MSNPCLPLVEILDDIVSLFCKEPKTLQDSFLVVKSWVPRTSSPVSSSFRPKPSNRRNVPGSLQPLFAPHVRYLDSISLNCHGGRCRNGCLDSQLFPCCTLGYEHARSKPLRDLSRPVPRGFTRPKTSPPLFYPTTILTDFLPYSFPSLC